MDIQELDYQMYVAQTFAKHARRALPADEAGEIAFDLLTSMGNKWQLRSRVERARKAILDGYGHVMGHKPVPLSVYEEYRREVELFRLV